MAITYPLTPPATPGYRTSGFRGRTAVGAHTSPFTFGMQTYLWDGERWEVQLSLPPMRRAQAAAWQAFLLALRGMAGTFLLGDPDAPAPRGTWAGTPLVNGAGQSGAVLALDGLSNGATIKAGDYLQLGSGSTARLHMVLQDVTVGGSGVAVLDLFPRLRGAPADNAAIVTSAPKGLFRLATNAVEWDTDHVSRYGITFPAVEAL